MARGVRQGATGEGQRPALPHKDAQAGSDGSRLESWGLTPFGSTSGADLCRVREQGPLTSQLRRANPAHRCDVGTRGADDTSLRNAVMLDAVVELDAVLALIGCVSGCLATAGRGRGLIEAVIASIHFDAFLDGCQSARRDAQRGRDSPSREASPTCGDHKCGKVLRRGVGTVCGMTGARHSGGTTRAQMRPCAAVRVERAGGCAPAGVRRPHLNVATRVPALACRDDDQCPRLDVGSALSKPNTQGRCRRLPAPTQRLGIQRGSAGGWLWSPAPPPLRM
jgi:hypothetical protein